MMVVCPATPNSGGRQEDKSQRNAQHANHCLHHGIYRLIDPILLLSSSAESPDTRITFSRLLGPEAMVTEQCGTFKRFTKNSMQASLARPSTGGEVRETLSASPSSPVIAFLFARGRTLTANVTPPFDCRMGITDSFSAKMLSRPAAELPPPSFAGAAACVISRCLPSERSRTQAWLHSQ